MNLKRLVWSGHSAACFLTAAGKRAGVPAPHTANLHLPLDLALAVGSGFRSANCR